MTPDKFAGPKLAAPKFSTRPNSSITASSRPSPSTRHHPGPALALPALASSSKALHMRAVGTRALCLLATLSRALDLIAVTAKALYQITYSGLMRKKDPKPYSQIFAPSLLPMSSCPGTPSSIEGMAPTRSSTAGAASPRLS